METITKDFEETRKELIGGSDIAAVMGMNRWETPLSLWARKTGKIPPTEMNEAMELGTELEDFVARKFAKNTGFRIRRDSRTFEHPKYSYMVAHIDRWILGTDAILEVKTCSAYKVKEWDGEEIPIEYVLQANWYCGILKKSSCWLAVLIGGQKYLHKEMQFDEELFRKQVESARVFWEEFVQKDQPPMAISGDSETLLAMFPSAAGDLLEIKDPEKKEYVNSAIEHRSEVSREIDDAMKEKEDIDAKLKQVIGEAPGILTDRFKITWTPQVSRRADPEAMRAAGVFEKFSKESSTRVLRVSSNNGQKKENKK